MKKNGDDHKEPLTPVEQLQEKPTAFLIVGIGASAGGIQALQNFFSNTAVASNMAYVVILHLSPDHDSELAAILQQVTQIPVTQVTERTVIAPDHIYVVPPDRHLTIEGGYIAVSPNLNIEERRAPVDIFFRTLADQHGPRAISVVLSGTGANGSMGLKRIKERGGAAFVQNPREAEFNEMPRNAIATELVDEVLNVADIPARIMAYRDSIGTVQISEEIDLRPEQQQQALRDIFAQLRVRTGHDFSNYKRPTLLRRIERRINVHNLPDLPSYIALLQEHPEETHALLKDLLISVTNFFRDSKAFTYLEQHVIPGLFAGKTSADQVRIWVAGCATGEEAYSVAMLCAEHTLGVLDAPKVQIFATDIDETAIATAREGLYSLNDAADVSPERLRRFFTADGDCHRVRREIREMILFANHNFLKDPPFSKLDMVTCRNVLIYLNSTAQKRVIETFHFALRPKKFLFLGTSESVDGASDLYALHSRDHHIFQTREVVARSYPVPDSVPQFLVSKTDLLEKPEERESRGDRISFGELHQRMLEQYAPPSVVVNEEYEIVHMTERAGRYFEFAGGEPTQNLLKLIRSEIRLELRAALYQAVHNKIAVEARGIKLSLSGQQQILDIHVRPVLENSDAARGFILVIFKPSQEVLQDGASVMIASDEPMARQLEEELIGLKTQLRNSIEHHEYQAEELKASNEELQAMNEELRSAAEELETSKEELQSINEELRTVNQELKVKIDETSVTSNNLQNLVNSTNIGTIFLDRSFAIRLFTPAILDIFNLKTGDYGRPVTDITNKLQYTDLLQDAESVLEKLTVVEREVGTNDNRFLMMRLLPYRTTDDRINGVVITFFDITDRKKSEEALRISEERQVFLLQLTDALRPLGDALAIEREACRQLGEKLNADHTYYAEIDVAKDYGVIRYDHARGGEIPYVAEYRVSDLSFVIALYQRGEQVVVNDAFTSPLIPNADRAATAAAHIAWIAIPVVKDGLLVGSFCVAMRTRREWSTHEVELTAEAAERVWTAIQRARVETALRKSEQRLRRIVNMPRIGVLTFDYAGNMLMANDAFLEMTGHDRAVFETQALTWRDFTPPEHMDESARVMELLLTTGQGGPYEKEYIKKDGTRLWMMFVAADLGDGTLVEYAIDISDRKLAQQQLQELNGRLEQQVTERTGELTSSHNLLQATLNTSMNMIQVFQAIRDENGEITDFQWILNNAASEKIYGDVIGERLLEKNPGVIKAGIFEHFKQVTETAIPQQYEKNYVYEQFDGWFYQSVVKLNDGVATSTLDITSRKHGELELRESRDLLQSILDNSFIAMSVLKALHDEWGNIYDFEIKLTNRELNRETGRADLVGKHYAQEYPGIKQTGLYDVMLRVMETGKPEGLEYFYPYDGFTKWFSCMFVRMEDGLVASNMDITDRKKSEEKIRKSEEQLRMFVTASSDLVYQMSADWTSMFALQSENFLSKTDVVTNKWMLLYIPADERSKVQAAIDQAILHKQVFELEHRVILANGEIGWAFSRAVPLLQPNGDILEWFGVTSDITERKLSEEVREKDFLLLQQAEKVATTGTWDYNLVKGTFHWSEGMYRLFSLERGKEVEPDIYVQYATADCREVAARIANYILSGHTEFEETVTITTNGTEKILQIKAMVIKNNEGQPVRVLGVDMDVTASRETENKLRRIEAEQQLEIFRVTLRTQEVERRRISESLHNGLGQLLYGIKISMNHLNSINALENDKDYTSAKLYTENLLTDAIQESRRISHELMPMVLEEFGLKAAIDDICKQLQNGVKFNCTVQLKGVKLDKYFELAVYRSTQELMLNVVKHADATKADVSIKNQDGKIVIRVEDDGKGITAAAGEKPGIGLASIRSKASLLNGGVNVTSAPGKGTVVEVWLSIDAYKIENN